MAPVTEQYPDPRLGVSPSLKDGVDPLLLPLWAKSDMRSHTPDTGTPLVSHLLDAAGVASRLWDTWVPPSTKETIARAFGGDDDQARTYAMVAAGLHDLGKASPAFQYQVRNFHAMLDPSLQGSPRHPLVDFDDKESRNNFYAHKARVHHTRAGAYYLNENYFSSYPENASGADTLIACVAGHHGRFMPPSGTGDLKVEEINYGFGKAPWRRIRQSLIELVLTVIGAPEDYLHRLTEVRFPLASSVMAAGLTVMSDWVASSEDLIPLTPRSEWGDLPLSLDRGTRAVDLLKLPPTWTPAEPDTSVDAYYVKRFPDEKRGTFTPTPLQRTAVDVAMGHPDPPGFMLIEAATGSGKTEAALAAAEVLAARHGRSGIAYVVPTRATANAAYTRVKKWLDAVSPDKATLTLHHGTAVFNDEFAFDVKQGRKSAPAVSAFDSTNTCDATECSGGHEVHEWLASGGKRMLATAVVGTIDAVLGACLDEKHIAMRHLGIASKVLVIDEVHSSDAYMLVYLSRLLEWAGLYGVPVIAMTATATPTLRHKLHSAYTRRTVELPNDIGFPVITSSRIGSPEVSVAEASVVPGTVEDRTVRFTIDHTLREPEDLAMRAVEFYGKGGVVGVVCNTVLRAQRVHSAIKSVLPDGLVTLNHARFTSHDRQVKDSELIRLLGKSQLSRDPRIIVSTQVVEQSLDIDFDVMLSDAAPLDYLIQRAGRVHRHVRKRRPKGMESPEVLVAGFDPDDAALFVRGTGLNTSSVYPVWQGMSAVAWIGDSRTFSPLTDTRDVMRVLDGDPSLIPPPWKAKWATSLAASHLKDDKAVSKAGVWLIGRPDDGEHYSMQNFPFTVGSPPEDLGRNKAVRNNLVHENLVILWDDDGAARLMPEVVPEAYRDSDLSVDFRRTSRPSEHWWPYRSAARSMVSLGHVLVLGEDSFWHTLQKDYGTLLLRPGMRSSWFDPRTRYVALRRVSPGDYRGEVGPWSVSYSSGSGLIVEHNGSL